MSDDTAIDVARVEADVPFGRSRLLKGLGVALFSSVISACGTGCRTTNCSFPLCPGCNSTTNVCNSPAGCVEFEGACITGLPFENCWCMCSGGVKSQCCDFEYPNGAGWAYCNCKKTLGTC